MVCEVARRGRFLVADPYLEPGAPISLGRRGSLPVDAGELVAVEVHAGRGRVVERLGRASDIRALMRGVLIEGGVGTPYPPQALGEARAAATEPDRLDEGRVDLRSLTTVTVDPPDARDFDDAISVVADGDELVVSVHIADVSFHVRPGTALDQEAARRALSVYVPGRVEPMLPAELSNGACSLKQDHDRRAVTVEVRFDAALRAGEPRFLRSLIRSDARLDYTEAHEILEGAPTTRPQAVVETLRGADRVSAELRRRRFARGALEIEAHELVFDLKDGHVADARRDAEPRAHSLVEELMILANEQVAEFLSRRKLPALYRVHRAPEPPAIDSLVSRFADLGVPTAPVPKHLSESETSAWVSAQARVLGTFIRGRGQAGEAFWSLLLRSLDQARYSPENLGHTGLASKAYCHFTSPIRRYPDLVCHRSLLAAIGQGETLPAGGNELAELAEQASATERVAAEIERRADGICAASFLVDELRDDREREHAGEITGLIGAGLFVRFSDVFEGFLPSRRLDRGDRFEPNELATALVGQGNGKRFRLGDPIDVQVSEIDAPR
ncbi:MAG: RNB domain-containing ribonuclease, partial [Gaiellales bacterium]